MKKQNKGEKKKNGKKKEMKSLPAAYISKSVNRPPQLYSKSDSCRISHREMICPISGSVNYSAWGYSVNPAALQVFPWLSQVARNYETYSFAKLRFVYEPVVGTSTNGLFMMAVDYDASDPDPASEMDLMSYSGAVQGPVYSSLTLDCPPNRMKALSGRLFTRWAAMAGNQDIKTYDLGKLVLASAGAANGTRTGSLYVEYTVDLFTPGIPQGEEDYEASAKIIAGGGGIAKATPFGAASAVTQGVAFPVYTALNDILTFKEPGEYMIKTSVTGTGLNSADATVLGGSVPHKVRQDALSNAAGTSLWETYFVQVAESLQTLTLAYNAATTVTALGAYLSPFKYGIR